MLDCQVSLLTYIAQYFWADGRVPGPLGSAHASVVPYGALGTADGHLIVAVFAEKFWAGFCRAAGRPEVASRYQRAPSPLTERTKTSSPAPGAPWPSLWPVTPPGPGKSEDAVVPVT